MHEEKCERSEAKEHFKQMIADIENHDRLKFNDIRSRL